MMDAINFRPLTLRGCRRNTWNLRVERLVETFDTISILSEGLVESLIEDEVEHDAAWHSQSRFRVALADAASKLSESLEVRLRELTDLLDEVDDLDSSAKTEG